MPLPEDFWFLFLANLPIVIALFIAQQRGWFILGINHNAELKAKDDQLAAKDKTIEFRELLRQEVIKDRQLLEERDKEKTEALRELTEVVKQTLALNDRLLNETLTQRWDGSDRRTQ